MADLATLKLDADELADDIDEDLAAVLDEDLVAILDAEQDEDEDDA